jgi:DNA integrity scanning protein DisA with diadenylate cyclase activity
VKSCQPQVLEPTLTLALEIAREGYEGQPAGTIFTIGRARDVLASSRPLILDPLAGHVPHLTRVTDDRLRGTVKQLARLDGAFVVDDDGVVVAACRYLDVPTTDVEMSFGLGSRHLAAAAISKHLRIVAIAASTTGLVRVFDAGEIVAVV